MMTMNALFIHLHIGCFLRLSSGLDSRFVLAQNLISNYPKSGKTVVPTEDAKVRVFIQILNVFGLNSNEVLEMNGWLTAYWKDPNLSWDINKYGGIRNVILSGENIWKPDLGIRNSKQFESKDMSNIEDRTIFLEARSNGEVSYTGYFISETQCPTRMRQFPFDKQKCPVVVGTFYSPISEYSFKVVNVTYEKFGMDSPGQWMVTSFEIENIFTNSSTLRYGSFQENKVFVHLHRKPMYNVALIIIPYSLICIISFNIFAINDPSERFEVAVNILLSMALFIMIVAEDSTKSMITLSVLNLVMLSNMGVTVVVILMAFVIFSGARSDVFQ